LRLSGFRGNSVVVFFYPEDDTPGCTTEACAFRDDHVAYLKSNAVILGISPDSADSHGEFKAKYGLPFPLLVDADHQVALKYGAWGSKTIRGKEEVGVLRSTFVVGPDGRIRAIFRRVQVEGHSREVLEAVRR
jgi:peroxiredoxin Q/BCP